MSGPFQKYQVDPPPIYAAGQLPNTGPGLQYWAMYGKVFEHPNWLSNVLLQSICLIIPIVGPIVLLGYRYEIMEQRLRDPTGWDRPFDFNRFSDYLSRGVWPFISGLLLGLIMTPLMVVLWLVAYALLAVIVLLAASIDPTAGVLSVFLWIGMIFVLVMASSILMAVLTIPMNIAAGIGQDLGAAFNFQFIKGFVGLTWRELMLGSVFLGVTSLFVMILGQLALCIGAIPAGALIFAAHGNLEHQLYGIYLSRGGTPVAGKPMSPGFQQQPYRAPTGW